MSKIKVFCFGFGQVAESFINKLINEKKDFESKTSSKKAKKILENFEVELKNFKQVCPIEMLDKLENPISLNKLKFKSA